MRELLQAQFETRNKRLGELNRMIADSEAKINEAKRQLGNMVDQRNHAAGAVNAIVELIRAADAAEKAAQAAPASEVEEAGAR